MPIRVALLCAAVLLGGCDGHELTEADCALIKDRLEKAWNRDAVAAQRLAETDQFNQFIRDEGDRIGDNWMKQCVLLVGREVSEAELECLTRSQTIDDVSACAR